MNSRSIKVMALLRLGDWSDVVTEDGVKKDLCFWFFLLVAYGVIEEGGCLESRDE